MLDLILNIRYTEIIQANMRDHELSCSTGCICDVLNEPKNGLSTNHVALLSFSARIEYFADTP